MHASLDLMWWREYKNFEFESNGSVHLAYNPSFSACFFQPEQYFSLTTNQPTVFFSQLISTVERGRCKQGPGSFSSFFFPLSHHTSKLDGSLNFVTEAHVLLTFPNTYSYRSNPRMRTRDTSSINRSCPENWTFFCEMAVFLCRPTPKRTRHHDKATSIGEGASQYHSFTLQFTHSCYIVHKTLMCLLKAPVSN
jgi:hypothetical protein